jgi:branched-chain amino acid transport system permease protein
MELISDYVYSVLILFNIYLLLGLSLQITVGWTGLLNLGHLGFYAIGAYTSALLIKAGVPFVIAFSAAVAVAICAGVLLARLANQFHGDYYALSTMAFGIFVGSLLTNLRSITGGTLGVIGIPRPTILGVVFHSTRTYFLFTAVVTICLTFLFYKVLSSPYGTALEAARDDEIAAHTLGKDTKQLKTVSVALSALGAGVAGVLYAHYIQFLSPSAFAIFNLLPVLAIVVIAGLTSFRGTVLATAFMVFLPEGLRLFAVASSTVGVFENLLYGTVILVVLLLLPTGLEGKVEL